MFFLRGINVGAAKRLPMSQLREILQALGYTDCQTILQSGTALAVRESIDLDLAARELSMALHSELGLEVPVIALGGEQVAQIVEGFPGEMSGIEGSKVLGHVTSKPIPNPIALEIERRLGDQVRLGTRVIYQACPEGVLAAIDLSKLVGTLDGSLTLTARNRNTFDRIARLLRRSER